MRLSLCARGYSHHAHHTLLRSLGALLASVPASVSHFLFLTKLLVLVFAPLRLSTLRLCASSSLHLCAFAPLFYSRLSALLFWFCSASRLWFCSATRLAASPPLHSPLFLHSPLPLHSSLLCIRSSYETSTNVYPFTSINTRTIHQNIFRAF